MKNPIIIGLDCATVDKKCGLAMGGIGSSGVQVTDVYLPKERGKAVKTILDWLQNVDCALLAIDAPLGWPSLLSQVLIGHHAGEKIATAKNELFSRLTDRVVAKTKKPLDVGADRIARTAHRALEILGELRERTHKPIDLVWRPEECNGISVIEVYPAATARAHKLDLKGYKNATTRDVSRKQLVESLADKVHLSLDVRTAIKTDHELDAVLCVIAGADFLQNDATPPQEADCVQVKQEGWIWVKKKS